MVQRIEQKLKNFEGSFQGEARKKADIEGQIKQEIESLSTLRISLAEDFRNKFKQTLQQLESQMERKILKSADSLKSDVSQLAEYLHQIKKAQGNKQD